MWITHMATCVLFRLHMPRRYGDIPFGSNRTWQKVHNLRMIQILETRKMAEGATDSSPEETGNHDLTISSNVDASEMDYLEGNKGTLFKFGFGLPELYKLSLEYYRKGKM